LSARPTFSSSCSAVATASVFAICFTRSGASMTFSSTDMCGHRLKCWNTMPMSGRTVRAARLMAASGLGCAITVPCMVTRPSDGSSSRARQRSSVVLPEPLGPTMHTTSRSESASDTRVSTWLVPNRFDTPSAAMIGVTAAARVSAVSLRMAAVMHPRLPYNRALCLIYQHMCNGFRSSL
jgi:hypothetical protein